MSYKLTATVNCPADDCPAFQVESETGDVIVQGYMLSAEQMAGTNAAGGPLPGGEGRLRIPGEVFASLVAQHQAR